MAGLDDFRKPIDPEPSMRLWIGLAQKRMLSSLIAAQGPGGEPLFRLADSTIRRKKHAQIGFDTGAMANALVSPTAFTLYIGAAGAAAEVYAGQGPTVETINRFLAPNRTYIGWMSERTKSGKRKAWPVLKGHKKRDFVGLDARDQEAAEADLIERMLRGWGFK